MPHIFGESERAVAYGLAIAQCEDDLLGVVRALHEGVGRRAEIEGPGFLATDTTARRLGHAHYARLAWPSLDPTLRGMILAFCDGVNDYLIDHADELPFAVEPIQPVQVVAWHRKIIASRAAQISHIDARTPSGQPHPRIAPEKSNSWVVSGSKTASGRVMIHLDPHWPYPEPGATLRLYESHLHGGRLDVAGFGLLGVPTVGIGVSSFAGWTFTDGGADSSDAYELLINPANNDEYLFDDRWEKMSVRTETIRIRQPNGQYQDQQLTVRESRHGPVFKRISQQRVVVYAAAYSGNRRADTIEQFYRLSIARTTEEFNAALVMNRITYWNCIWGTAAGDIGYVQFGACPQRSGDFDWERRVPGWTSRTLYRGMVPYREMPIVVNPPTGFLQNCNNAANEVTPGLTFTPADFATGVLWGHVGQYRARSLRATELLSQEVLFTLEDGRRIAFDKRVKAAENWVPFVLAAYQKSADKPAGDAPQLIEILASWDFEAGIDSLGATVFQAWRRGCAVLFPGPDETIGRDVHEIQDTPILRIKALQALKFAVRDLLLSLGQIDVPWGQIKRLRRGDQQWPLGGGAGSAMGPLKLECLRSTGAGKMSVENELLRLFAEGGQSVPTVALLGSTPIVRTITPYGQSSRADSPHYADQAPLYSAERLRDVPWGSAELVGQTESITIYTVRPR